MTATEIAALRALLERATPGPWRIEGPGDGWGDHAAILPLGEDTLSVVNQHASRAWKKDAALIVALRNAAPSLLDALDAALAASPEVKPTGEGTRVGLCLCGHPRNHHLLPDGGECLEGMDPDGNVFCACTGCAPAPPSEVVEPAPYPATPDHIQIVGASLEQVDAFNMNPGTKWVIYFVAPGGATAQTFASLTRYPGINPSPPAPEEAKPC